MEPRGDDPASDTGPDNDATSPAPLAPPGMGGAAVDGSPAAHAQPDPREMPLGVFVAVDGSSAAQADPQERRWAERRALDRRMDDAALRASLVAMPIWALALALAATPMALAIGLQRPAAGLAWAALAAACAATMWRMPRRARHAPAGTPDPRRTRHRVLAVAAVAGALAAVGPWLAAAGAAHAVAAVLCTALAFAGVVLLGPLRQVVLGLAVLPLSAGAALAWGLAEWPLRSLVGGAAMAAAAGLVAVARHRHHAWHQNTRALIEQGARLRDLESERDAAWRADQDKSRFLAIASHDLRQPVHALGLFAATLHKRLAHTPDEPLARNMMRAIDGLERSFNAMLDISRLDAGVMTPRLQTFPLRDMFRRLHMHYAGQAELAGLGLRFSPGGKSVTSDPQLLERIVGNLIQNAIKYTERGGIVVLARSTRTHVNVEIWDTGSGIAPDVLPRIFEEFYQVGRGERDRSHGLGMGLAIVKRLAGLLDHRLVVASRPGRGTMFRIGIALGQLPGIQEDMAPADTVPMEVHGSQMVLVIDDEEPIREGLRLLLEEWGYHVVTAADAAQAEHAATALEGRVDLVLSDLHLGDGPDGLEAIAEVRRLCGRDVPAVLVTGDTAQAEIQRVTACGYPVLFKPVQPRRLFEALRNALA